MNDEISVKEKEGELGLVLTGGGARGAYQSGAISALAEICREVGMAWPFKILAGTSAGAINCSFLASHLYNKEGVQVGQELNQVWSLLRMEEVFRGDAPNMILNAFNWMSMISTGGKIRLKKDESMSLLDTSPLRKYLAHAMDFENIPRSVSNGAINSLAVTAFCYDSGVSQTFCHTHKDFDIWKRIKREGIRADISIDHIMASSAIPILFPPVLLGDHYYGDGGLRNYNPFSPAIKLGAKKVMVIGVRKQAKGPEIQVRPTLGKVLGIILNGLFLDAIYWDLEILQRINHAISKVEPKGGETELRKIDVCLISPSKDIGLMAKDEFSSLSRTMRYFVRGLGGKEETADFLSYILFTPSFTKKLVELGRHDVFAKRREIEFFLKKKESSSELADPISAA